jgi:hypothetical protein
MLARDTIVAADAAPRRSAGSSEARMSYLRPGAVCAPAGCSTRNTWVRLVSDVDADQKHVMLDASVLLERTALERTLNVVPALSSDPGFQFFVPQSLFSAGEGPDSGPLRDFFEIGSWVDPVEVQARLQPVNVSLWKRPQSATDQFAEFYGDLGEVVPTGTIQEILFDEWFFLTHDSWLVSRVKNTFHALTRAGELGVELLDVLVRRTLKKDVSYIVRTADRLRVLGKWIAVGGPLVVTLLNPIAGAVVGGVAGGFLLLDPPELQVTGSII